MTPAARVAAAIEILDNISSGLAAEQALTRWARKSRFAGSKDRAAVRDHVFDVLRNRASANCIGGGDSGRALMVGNLLLLGEDPELYFTGEGHAPSPLTTEERRAVTATDACAQIWNLPAWLVQELQDSLGEGARATDDALTRRAPVTVRVNERLDRPADIISQLQAEGIIARQNAVCATALTITEGARKLRNSKCYASGAVELQDASSQAVVAALPAALKCLDYCAGGGGKSLALAAQENRHVYAHDIDPARMSDLPVRAARADANITILRTDQIAANLPFDLVLCDAPCSGSGAWRRSPEAKWNLSQSRLDELCALQDRILSTSAQFVSSDGVLAYATCSVLKRENEDRVSAFLAKNPDWQCVFSKRFDITTEGDGFYTAHLTRVPI